MQLACVIYEVNGAVNFFGVFPVHVEILSLASSNSMTGYAWERLGIPLMKGRRRFNASAVSSALFRSFRLDRFSKANFEISSRHFPRSESIRWRALIKGDAAYFK